MKQIRRRMLHKLGFFGMGAEPEIQLTTKLNTI